MTAPGERMITARELFESIKDLLRRGKINPDVPVRVIHPYMVNINGLWTPDEREGPVRIVDFHAGSGTLELTIE